MSRDCSASPLPRRRTLRKNHGKEMETNKTMSEGKNLKILTAKQIAEDVNLEEEANVAEESYKQALGEPYVGAQERTIATGDVDEETYKQVLGELFVGVESLKVWIANEETKHGCLEEAVYVTAVLGRLLAVLEEAKPQ